MTDFLLFFSKASVSGVKYCLRAKKKADTYLCRGERLEENWVSATRMLCLQG